MILGRFLMRGSQTYSEFMITEDVVGKVFKCINLGIPDW